MRDEALTQRDDDDRAGGERELLVRVLAGEARAWRELVSAFLPAVYDFAWATVGAAHAAAVTEAAFAAIYERLGEAERLPLAPWIMGRTREAVLAAPAARDDDVPDELQAARALGVQRHSVLYLVVREGLDDDALAITLNARRASAVLVRERVLAAAEAALDGQGGLDAYASLPRQAPPGDLAARIVEGWAGPPARRVPVPAPGAFVPAADWAPPIAEPVRSMRGRVLATVLAVAATLLGVALVLPSSPIALTRNSASKATIALSAASSPTPGAGTVVTVPASTGGGTPTPGNPGAGPGRSPSPTELAGVLTATGTPTAGATATRTPTPVSPTATSTATSTATPTSTATATATVATPTPTSTPTVTPTQCRKAISSNVSQLTIGPSGQSSFEVLNSFCGPVEFSVAAGAAWLSVSPAAGALDSGRRATISVAATVSEPGTYTGAISVSSPDAGGFTIAVTYVAE
ncbi:MAG: hypothetical protein M0R74_06175 [Dehalococcoidia bacterium]|nr:hypothetical protein [Dehalococcoidia bacterium]